MKISHNTDARGPAVNVKVYNLTRDVPADAEGTEAQQASAWEQAGRAWWHGADLIAKRHGFRQVFSTGRMGGWLYTDPLPETPTDENGDETGAAEYPAAFLSELSALLDRAPEFYADTLAELIADDEAEAEAQAARDAMPARLALALHDLHTQCVYMGAPATHPDMAAASSALADYLDQLLDDECQRDLTPEESRIVAAARGDA